MRVRSSRWLLMTGVLVVIGGCRHTDRCSTACKPTCCEGAKPTTTLPIMPRVLPQPIPNKVSESVIPVEGTSKPIALRPALKQERIPVQQVENKAPETPSLGHAPNHRWLVGKLERDVATECWFIRYADPGENDTHGGRLELLGTGPMSGFRAGQIVRAEGELVDPAPLQTQSAYRVRSLQAVRQ